MRLYLGFLFLAILSLFSLDYIYSRTLTADRELVFVRLSKSDVVGSVIENQELVNSDSIENFAKKTISILFNYNPGKVEEYLDKNNVQDLFISKKYYDRFREKFIVWSNAEFKINNISIKEAISTSGQLKMISSGEGKYLWEYQSMIPVLNRGVGSNQTEKVYIKLFFVYLGVDKGLGLYDVKLSY